MRLEVESCILSRQFHHHVKQKTCKVSDPPQFAHVGQENVDHSFWAKLSFGSKILGWSTSGLLLNTINRMQFFGSWNVRPPFAATVNFKLNVSDQTINPLDQLESFSRQFIAHNPIRRHAIFIRTIITRARSYNVWVEVFLRSEFWKSIQTITLQSSRWRF